MLKYGSSTIKCKISSTKQLYCHSRQRLKNSRYVLVKVCGVLFPSCMPLRFLTQRAGLKILIITDILFIGFFSSFLPSFLSSFRLVHSTPSSMHLFSSSMRTPICLDTSTCLSGTYRLSRKFAYRKREREKGQIEILRGYMRQGRGKKTQESI